MLSRAGKRLPSMSERMDSLENLNKDSVSPDVIDNKPEDSLTAEWAEGVKAEQGNELKPKQVKRQPKVSFKADPLKYYTLAMVDPDAPSRADPSLREILHLMVVNIPGSDVTQGDVLAEYIGAAPPKGTGLHRYVIVVFEQKEKLQSDMMKLTNTSLVGRTNFSVRKYAIQHNLSLVAANFFKAQHDSYVPILEDQLY